MTRGDAPWTDGGWAALWHEVVERSEGPRERRPKDFWADRAQDYAHRVRRSAGLRHTLREAVLGRLAPGGSVIDIGAGSGGWTVPIARRAGRVTAIDSSPAMVALLREAVAREGLDTVDIVPGTWPEVPVDRHDYSVAAHSMYGSPDLPGFVDRMTRCTRRTCFLVIRLPRRGGVMDEAARLVRGYPFDSPNFVIAYNVMLDLGLAPDVLVDHEPMPPRTSAGVDEALARVKRHLGLAPGDTEHDAPLRDLLSRRLTARDGELVWPDETLSALVSWEAA